MIFSYKIIEMARTHAHTHGKSHTNRPTSKNAPSWTISNEEIVSTIVNFGKDGMGASEIGLRFRLNLHYHW